MPSKIAPLATPPAAARIGTFSIPHTFKVDTTSGVLSDLQLMAAGREAKGHGIYIDERTLETGQEVVAARGGRLKGYATHHHNGPTGWSWENEKSELDVVGFFSSIAIAKSQLVAGRFEFYDTYKAASPDEYARLMEMAAKTPELLGLSVEVWGYVVYVGADGVEYSQRPEDIELANEGMPSLRITDLWAAAFVSDGAATDGLFAKLGARGKDVLSALRSLFGPGGELAEKTAGHVPATNVPATQTAPATNPESTAMLKIIEAINTKFGANPAQFAQAMSILGKKPDITIEALETQLATESLTAAQGEITTLKASLATITTERDTARTQLATVTTERDTLKNEIATLKGSGSPGVSLSAPVGSPGAAAGNPWLNGQINESEQCRIEKTDAARATMLKAQAAEANKAAKK